MHKLLENNLKSKSGGNNVQVFWDRLTDLQKKSLELADKSVDPDLNKAIVDLQNTIVDQTILGEKE